MQCWNWQVGVDMVISWPIWGQKLQITWGLAAKKNMTIVNFWFSLFRYIWSFWDHWQKTVQLNIVTNIDVFHFIWLPDSQNIIQIYPDTLQTYSRHTPDTTQTQDFCSIISNKTILRYSTNGKCNLNQHIFVISMSWNTVLRHHFVRQSLEIE